MGGFGGSLNAVFGCDACLLRKKKKLARRGWGFKMRVGYERGKEKGKGSYGCGTGCDEEGGVFEPGLCGGEVGHFFYSSSDRSGRELCKSKNGKLQCAVQNNLKSMSCFVASNCGW